MLPWILCGALTVIVTTLIIKIILMKKSINEICDCISEHLYSDTNQLIYISSGDRTLRSLANEISKHLSELRTQRNRYLNGDRELKEAVSNISHDLRTPLTAIYGYLDLLEAEEKSQNAQRYIEQITNRIEALKMLTEELFRYSVISSVSDLDCKRLNVTEVLEDRLISFHEKLEQKNILPDISIPENAIWRTLDKSALSRIFNNIIENAVKYSDGDFSVTVSGECRITFSNTACSLSQVDVGKLFDRFYTVDSARRSTGLGLSIAKLLTERMNGNIFANYKNNVLSITVSF